MWRQRAASGVLLSALFASACAGSPRSFAHGVFRDRDTTYRVGPLPPEWSRLPLRGGGDLAFANHEGGTIYADSTCGQPSEDGPLPVLLRRMLFDVQVVRELSRRELTLDGRRALATHLVGELDGVPVELELVVLEKDGCVYDLGLIAGEAAFPERRPDFERFALGFETVGGPR